MKTFTERFDEMLEYLDITPYKLSRELGTSDSVISTIRSGKNKPSFDFLNKLLSKYETLDLNYLVTGQGILVKKKPDQSGKNGGVIALNEAQNNNLVEESGEQYGSFVTNSVTKPSQNTPKGNVFKGNTAFVMPKVVTVNESGIDNIVYVPVKAQAGYLLGYGDPEFISELPSFRIPGLSNSTFRMFDVDGLSMSPTLSHQDRVICQWVDNINEIRDNRIYVALLQDGICVKRILNRIEERGKLYLKSDTITHRADYPIKEISPEEIIELWYVRMKLSSDLSEPTEIYHRMADMEINYLTLMTTLKAKNIL